MEPVLIVGIIFGFVSFSAYLRFRTKQLEHGADTMGSQLHKENEQLRQKTESLEQRVRVLESIVTTKEYTLGQEIDALAASDQT